MNYKILILILALLVSVINALKLSHEKDLSISYVYK